MDGRALGLPGGTDGIGVGRLGLLVADASCVTRKLGPKVAGLALGDPGGTDGAPVVGLLTTAAAAPKVSL